MDWDYAINNTLGIKKEEVLQSYPDTCDIKSEQLILESKGIQITETELRDESMAHDWYHPGMGTPLEDVGNLLELHGMTVERHINGTISDLLDDLSQERQIIVGLDSGELWTPGIYEQFEDIIHGLQADHALLFSGFSVDPLTGEQNVILTDPGTGDALIDYPADQFLDAWNDSGCFYISAF